MWPWEHLAVGYLSYSTYIHTVHRRTPEDHATLVALAGVLLPDLIDKPLAWGFGILPAGRSFGHSVLVAIPLVVFVAILGLLLGRLAITSAFAIGYGSHLAGDVVYPLVVKGDLEWGFLLWPIIPAESMGGSSTAVLPRVLELFRDFVDFLWSPAGAIYLSVEIVVFAVVTLMWIADGTPGVSWRPHR